jgi:hypothetical protein
LRISADCVGGAGWRPTDPVQSCIQFAAAAFQHVQNRGNIHFPHTKRAVAASGFPPTKSFKSTQTILLGRRKAQTAWSCLAYVFHELPGRQFAWQAFSNCNDAIRFSEVGDGVCCGKSVFLPAFSRLTSLEERSRTNDPTRRSIFSISSLFSPGFALGQ